MWGKDEVADLGRRDNEGPPPREVGRDWAAIAAGGNHSLAVERDGGLWAWGDNQSGQLGDGSGQQRSSPVKVGTDNDWTAVAAGSKHSLGLRAGGLYAWGANDEGQLGNGTNSNAPAPVKIDGNFVFIAAGGYHSIASKPDGSVWAWGASDRGQVGPGASTRPRAM